MRCPDFFILGAKKCGTTSLHHYLGQHPNVYLSVPKEPIFFEAEYHRGLAYYWETYFSGWQNETRVGEARHRNLYLPYVPDRIRQSIPNPQFIVIVRNPTDRAHSHWLGNYNAGLESLPFEEAIYEDLKRIEEGIDFEGEKGADLWTKSLGTLAEGPRRVNPSEFRTYLDSGYYSLQIRRYLDLFPRDSLTIVFLEDLAQSPQAVVSDLWSFLDVDRGNQLRDIGPRNASLSPTGQRVSRRVVDTGVHKLFPQRLRKLGLKWLKTLGERSSVMSSSVRGFLVDHYYDHNRDLERLTGRDLSHWDR